MSRLVRAVLLSLIVVSTVGCDQISKHIARAELARSGPVFLLGGALRLALAQNTGGFLSLGAGLPLALRNAVFILLAGLGLCLAAVYLIRGSRLTGLAFLSIALVCAGGLSNLLDRIFSAGRVTDFMIVAVGPLHTGVFNVADVAITAGCILFALSAAASKRGLARKQ